MRLAACGLLLDDFQESTCVLIRNLLDVAQGEAMYDMPPMRVRHFIRRIPSSGESWDRFGVVIYMTNRHLFIFDSSTSKANRLERKPILGLFELQRYEIVHQRGKSRSRANRPITAFCYPEHFSDRSYPG